MVRVSSSEFSKNLGLYQETALTQPVVVTSYGRDRTVTISADEYHRLKRRDRKVMTLDDFTEDDLREIRAARPSRAAAAFDHELK